MKIISDFKDYYDTVSKMDREPEPVYMRKTEVIEGWEKIRDFNLYIPSGAYLHVGHPVVIGFCGKFYGAIQMSHQYRDEVGELKWTHAYCYNADAVLDFAKKHYKKRDAEKFEEWFVKGRRPLDTFFGEDCEKGLNGLNKFMQDRRIPVLIADFGQYSTNKISLNGRLGTVEFAKVFDPYRAYQEINMYLSNIANPEKPIPEVSDKDLLEGKGFDPKWSFRQEPGQKKRKNKKK